MKVAIAGPGCSGTSLLVQLFGAWGFCTPDRPLHLPAKAGLETRIDSDSPYEVHKEPWAFEYIHKLDRGSLSIYKAFIILIGSSKAAVTSRVIQQRSDLALRLPEDQWFWGFGDSVPGLAVSSTKASAVEITLAVGLWKLLKSLTTQGRPVTPLNLPRLSQDFEYLRPMIGDPVGARCSQAEAFQARTAISNSRVKSSTPLNGVDP